MLTLLHHTTAVPQSQFPSLEALLAEPFPRTPEDLLQLEQRLSTAAAQVADQIVLVQLTRAHEDEAFVRQAIAHVRARSPVPLVHKGCRTTSVLESMEMLGAMPPQASPPPQGPCPDTRA